VQGQAKSSGSLYLKTYEEARCVLDRIEQFL